MSEETESFLEVSFEDGKISYNLNFENELRKLIRQLVSEEVKKVEEEIEEIEKMKPLVDKMDYFMNSVKENIERLKDAQYGAKFNVQVLVESKLRNEEALFMMRPLFEAYHYARCAEENFLKFLHEISKEFNG